jgi:hypothetical protein
MIDVEPLIREAFLRLDPLPAGAEGDWLDVLGRVQRPPRRRPRVGRRQLQVLVAAAVAVAIASVTTPLGAAIGRTFDGFSNWITGSPGTPASPEAQKAFEQANARSWAGFPPGTELRKLIETTASGSRFTLYGFRSGDALCLRLVATGPAKGANESCVPLQALQSGKEPALVVASDEPFGLPRLPPGSHGYKPALAIATFGIASDGVKAVVLHGDDGTHRAIVASNAFLYIDENPKKPSVKIRSAEAVARNGSTTPLLLAIAPYGANGTPAPDHFTLPRGPTHLDRRISGGTVSWIERREDRGRPIEPEVLNRMREGALTEVTFAREVQPDPANPARVAVLMGKLAHDRFQPGRQALCVFLVQGGGAGGGCGGLREMFAFEPFRLGSWLADGSDQYGYFSGLVSDDVAALKIFLANGTIENVPLKDNTFAVPVARALFPVRVVAYDSASRIIGLETIGPDTAQPHPVDGASWTTLEHAVAADGTSATFSTAPARGGGLCWRIRFSDGMTGSGAVCGPPYWEGSSGEVNLVVQDTSTGGALVYGRVSPDVASVVIHYRDGSKVTTTPRRGLVLVGAPQRVKPPANPVAEIVGFDRNGTQLGTEDYRHTPALPPPPPRQ